MVTKYQTPGVYYERVDVSTPAISAIRTDVTGFVGIAARGPVDMPVPVQSWRQFQSYFGGFTGSAYLAYAVRAFFENGGRRCWVVRVASRGPIAGAAFAGSTIQSSAGKDVWRVSAFSPGVWGNNLSIMIKETNQMQTKADPGNSRPNFSEVSSTSGFIRGTMVRLSQESATPVFKIVSDVDHIRRRILWVHDNPELRLPYDSPLTGFDANKSLFIESLEYTIIVKESGRLIAQFEQLSLVPEHNNYGPEVLRELEIPKIIKPDRSIPLAPPPLIIKELRELKEDPLDVFEIINISPGKFNLLTGGADGLALLTTYDFIGEEISPMDSDEQKERKRRGLRVFESVEEASLVDEVAIVSIPDIHIQPIPIPEKVEPQPPILDPCLPQKQPPVAVPVQRTVDVELPPVFSEHDIYRVQAALVQHCEERRDRIALLDPPFSISQDDEKGIGAVRAWRSRFDSKYAAFYYPWLKVVNPLRSNSDSITRAIPPSGHVSGQYADNDFTVGVHKAPANSPLVWIQDVTNHINDEVHGVLNPTGINAIRPLAGRGIRIFGARTVSSDPDWRFVNVRRLMMMIEKAIELSIQWAVFEPNNFITRTKIQLSLISFLSELWQQGALMGNTIEEAFFVRCDEENNPAHEREKGRLFADVGVAPSKPFEFIVLRVGRTGNEFEINESPMNTGGF